MTVLAHASAWMATKFAMLALVALAAGMSVLLFRVIRSQLRRTLSANARFPLAVLRRAGRVAQFAFVLLVLALLIPVLPLDHNTGESLRRCLTAGFIILCGWMAGLACDLAIERYVVRFKMDVEDNLLARKAVTQMRILKRTAEVAIGVVTIGFALMTFDSVRHLGISIFASAGVAGLAIGFAAKPLLGNLIAGIQLAITQPIRVDDAVVIDGEWGWVEELTATYIVIRLWDWRRLIVPLGYVLENPIQNWTRTSSALIGSALFYLDHTAEIGRIRAHFEELLKQSKRWDGNVANLQVTNMTERTVEVRALMSARNASLVWDLRCEIREKLLDFLHTEYPEALPRWRTVQELSQRAENLGKTTKN
jgi:small-conductance mechanosensitive channel